MPPLNVLADAAAHGHDEVGADQVNQLLGSLHGLGDLGLDVGRPPARRRDAGSQRPSCTARFFITPGRTVAIGGTEAGADDGGHQVTAESGTGHLQVAIHGMGLAVDHHGAQLLDALLGQGGGFLQEALVVGHVDVQVGAVGAQAGVQTGGAAGSQVTADVGGAEQQHLGLDLLNGLARSPWYRRRW